MNRITIEFPEDYPVGEPRIRAIAEVLGRIDFTGHITGQPLSMIATEHSVGITWPKSPVASAPQADATQSEEA